MSKSVTDEVLQAAEEPDFWKSLCPELNVTEDPYSDTVSAYHIDAHEMETSVRQIIKEGYFQTPPIIPQADIETLTDCISKVTQEGFPHVCALVYDEFWRVLGRLSNVLSPVLGSNYQLLQGVDIFHVRKGIEAAGLPPHRDYEFRKDVLRPDGRPTLASVWIPLTDVTPLNSCLYVLPTNLDPNCPGNLKKATIDSKLVPSIRALPAKAGSIICWNQHIIHWGARSSEWAAEERIALGTYYQSRDVAPYIEGLTFDLPSPIPFHFRLDIIRRSLRAQLVGSNEPSAMKRFKREGLIQKIRRSRRVAQVLPWNIFKRK